MPKARARAILRGLAAGKLRSRFAAFAARAGRMQEHGLVRPQALERRGDNIARAGEARLRVPHLSAALLVAEPLVEERESLAAVVGFAVLVAFRSAVFEHGGVLRLPV